MAAKVLEVDLSRPLQPLTHLETYSEARLLIKVHGFAVGEARVPVMGGRVEVDALAESIANWAGWYIWKHLLEDGLLAVPPDADFQSRGASGTPQQGEGEAFQRLKDSCIAGLGAEWVGRDPPCQQVRQGHTPFVTVAVATRHGFERIGPCLDALDKLDYPDYEILVVENVPQDSRLRHLVVERADHRYRYLQETRPGVSWTRNLAIQEARGEIIAFTDDNARPDPLWLLALVAALHRPGTALAAGRAYPLELENAVQEAVERLSRRDGGFERRHYDKALLGPSAHPYYANVLGGGYNLAGWTRVFRELGGFDPLLGRGSPAGSASDADLLYRLLESGYGLAYEPAALVWLVHPSDYNALLRHTYLGASGLFAFLTKCFLNEPRNRPVLLHYATRLWLKWYVRPYLKSLATLNIWEAHLQRAALQGSLAGPGIYRRNRKKAKESRPGRTRT